MLEEKIISVYNREYGIELGKEPEFDEIFVPKSISNILVLNSFQEDNSAGYIYNIIKNLNKNIMYYKKQHGKKNFDLLFSRIFLSLELIKKSELIKPNNDISMYILQKNYHGLAMSEYDVGHELIEQNKPFSFNFLKEAIINFKDYLGKKEEKGSIDPYIFAHLAGSYLELAFYVFREKKNEPNFLNMIKDSVQIAFDNLNKSIELTDKSKSIKFHQFFAKRLNNFSGLTKWEIYPLDKEFYFYLADITRDLFSRLDMKHPYTEPKV